MARQSFREWMAQVDRVLTAMCGLDSRDLEDWAYADAWEGGQSARSAAREALRNAGGW